MKVINKDNNAKNNTSVTVNGNILTFANDINIDALQSIIMGKKSAALRPHLIKFN